MKADQIKKIKTIINKSIEGAEKAGTAHDAAMKSTAALTGVKMMEGGLSERLQKISDELYEKEKETAELANQLKAADDDYNFKKEKLKKLLKEAEEFAPRDVWDERLQREDLPSDLDEVFDAIEEAKQKIDSITDNPHLLRQYEERKKEIALLEEQLESAGSEKERRLQDLSDKLENYQSRLTNIISQVNVKFSAYMSEVNCAGEIRLYKGGSENSDNDGRVRYNFKDWGIEILVKFREASALQVLSAQTHSGGERSVSTIMYLMGLQNLMKSPFRCVDEINQGLDERNERLVFKRIVANSTGTLGSRGPSDHCGQYFLITPKLLPNLEGMENEDITVLFVFSGPHNFANPRDWNVDKFIKERQAWNEVSEEEESPARGSKRKIRA
mmetsp:Transcript_36858/g.82914  ORF Transcript_36858/g.82914 Transcript_36858/m.82914 type:complete len:386 (+) Transcript_36858:2215-3372(+)